MAHCLPSALLNHRSPITYPRRYSWFLFTVVSSLHVGGFLLMLPQLYVNYRLKAVPKVSVAYVYILWMRLRPTSLFPVSLNCTCQACRIESLCSPAFRLLSSPLPTQMPMRGLLYRAVTIVVDDVFAFAVDSPTLHRVSVFRDDAVFLVALFQRWLYARPPQPAPQQNQLPALFHAPAQAPAADLAIARVPLLAPGLAPADAARSGVVAVTVATPGLATSGAVSGSDMGGNDVDVDIDVGLRNRRGNT